MDGGPSLRSVRGALLADRAVATALTRPITRGLLVDGAGFAPSPPMPAWRRPTGAESTIVEICVAGSGWLRMGGREHRITPGVGFVIPPGIPHSYGPVETPYQRWWCMLRGTEMPGLTAFLGVTVAEPLVEVRDLDGAVALLTEITASYELDQTSARLNDATGAAWRLLTRLAADRVLPPRSSPIERAMAYLVDHLETDVRVSDLADLVGIPPSRLAAQFHATTGGGVRAYQVRQRMARARDLLDTTGAAVADIAHAVGYADPYYFSRHFRRVHGLSPTAFRARRRP